MIRTDHDILRFDRSLEIANFRAILDINSNMSTAGNPTDCTLSAGTTSQTITNLFLNANLQTGETEEVSFMIAHTFDSAGTARLTCAASAAWAGNVMYPTITAISVQNLSIDMLTAAAGGDAN